MLSLKLRCNSVPEYYDSPSEPIGGDQSFALLSYRTGLDGVHSACACLDSEKREDAAAGANVEHHFVAKVHSVGEDSALVSSGAHVILQHVLLLREKAVELEVLLGRRGIRAIRECTVAGCVHSVHRAALIHMFGRLRIVMLCHRNGHCTRSGIGTRVRRSCWTVAYWMLCLTSVWSALISGII